MMMLAEQRLKDGVNNTTRERGDRRYGCNIMRHCDRGLTLPEEKVPESRPAVHLPLAVEGHSLL